VPDELTAAAGLAHVRAEATDPDAPCGSLGPKLGTARFWFRRRAHEHAVHAYDAQVTVGAAGTIDAALALDGIDEVVTVFLPRQVRLGRIPVLDRSLAVRGRRIPLGRRR
jgi:uncharacterized protein (TIGR03083 family)